jgi:hypothetical protein
LLVMSATMQWADIADHQQRDMSVLAKVEKM